eukprot:jgi/Bigna1/68640/fgenesh1_pg.6_\
MDSGKSEANADQDAIDEGEGIDEPARWSPCLFSGKKEGQWIQGLVMGVYDESTKRNVNVRLHAKAPIAKVHPRDVLVWRPVPFPDAEVGDEILVHAREPPIWYEAKIVDKNPDIEVFEIQYTGKDYPPCTNSFVTANQFFTPIDLSQRFTYDDQQKENVANKEAKRRDTEKDDFLMRGIADEPLRIISWKIDTDSKMEAGYKRTKSLLEAEYKRIESLLTILRGNKTEFLALQGVNTWLVEELMSLGWFKKRFPYSSYYLHGEKCLSNSSVLFSTFPLLSVEQHKYKDGNVFTLCTTKVKGRKLHILNIDLIEGEAHSEKRVADATLLCAVIKKIPSRKEDTILVGNFGFPPHTEPESTIFGPSFFVDAWRECCGQKNGYTRDPVNNNKNHSSSCQRLDYVFLRSEVWNPCDAKLIGNSQTPIPSPNFGIKVTLKFTAKRNGVLQDKEDEERENSQKSSAAENNFGIPVEQLTIASYNVGVDDPDESFSSYDRIEGANGIVETFVEARADVLCLQEVKPWLTTKLQKNSWFSNSFPYSTLDFEVGKSSNKSKKAPPFLPWYLCIYSKYPILVTSIYNRKPYISSRCFLCATLEVNNRRIDICNTQLNASLSGGCERAMNLGYIFRHLGQSKGADDAILAGSFNYKTDFQPENRVVKATGWEDAWNTADSATDGATFEPSRNIAIHSCPEAHLKAICNIWGDARLDRIFFRSDTDAMQCADSKLLGKMDIRQESTAEKKVQKKLCASRRYCILANFKLINSEQDL